MGMLAVATNGFVELYSRHNIDSLQLLIRTTLNIPATATLGCMRSYASDMVDVSNLVSAIKFSLDALDTLF